jgi:hypothetical protein
VQVAPNNIDDGQLLAEALPNLKARTDLDTLVTDGGFGSEVSDAALQEQNVTLIQTAIRGAQPNPDKFTLADFDIQQDEQSHPTTLTCPQGQIVPVTAGRTTGWQAHFDPAICATCPFQQTGRCRTQPQKRDPRYLLTFTTPEIRTAKRRQNHRKHIGDSHNLRSAVEATVRSVKHPFPAGKLPVRGKFRVTCMAIASAATTNVRRIQRYLIAKTKANQTIKGHQDTLRNSPNAGLVSFCAPAQAPLSRWAAPRLAFRPSFSC